MRLRRIFAIIPAAGRSQRMGRPKLLLPWKKSTIIDCVLRSWCDSDVTKVVVVIRIDDKSLVGACQAWPVELVLPNRDPVDMKQSIQCGLKHVIDFYRPTAQDWWMVAPADLPQLSSELINPLLDQCEAGGCVVPRFGGRQGHPVLLPWPLSADFFELGENQGLNRLLAGQELHFFDFPAVQRVADVDTPADYERLKGG